MFDPKKLLKKEDLMKRLNKVSKLINDTKETAAGVMLERRSGKDVDARTVRQLRLELLSEVEEFKNRQEWSPKSSERLSDLESFLRKSLLKPKLAVVGMSDVGKSHLTNTLLGTTKIPSDWSPTTSINIYIKHIEDRPLFFLDEVIILSGGSEGFDINRIDDKEYAEARVLASGDENLLVTYATRTAGTNKMRDEAKAAVIYLDSPILERCDIIDVPGFGTGDRDSDDQYAQESRQIADVILYLSVSNAFMRGADINFLKSSVDSLPLVEGLGRPLGNLFVLASQSHIIGDETKMNKILDAGMQRFYRSVPAEEWSARTKATGLRYSEKTVSERFYPYSSNDERARTYFEGELFKLLDTLPRLIEKETKKTLRALIDEQRNVIEEEIQNHSSILTDRERYSKQLHDFEMSEPGRRRDARNHRQEINQFVAERKEADLIRFDEEYDSIMQTDTIVSWLEQENLKKNEESQQELVSYLSNALKFRLNEVLEESTRQFVERVDGYVGDFENSLRTSSITAQDFKVAFNVKNAFVGGAAGTVALGGMATYVATLGNLGGYILVAKGAGILSTLGFNIAILGGMPGIMTGVATIGGPITLGIAMTAIIGVSVYTMLTSNGWKEDMAKSVGKAFEKNDARSQFMQSIVQYWHDTWISFEEGAKILDKEWVRRMEEMRDEIGSMDITMNEQKRKELLSYQGFLDDLKTVVR